MMKFDILFWGYVLLAMGLLCLPCSNDVRPGRQHLNPIS